MGSKHSIRRMTATGRKQTFVNVRKRPKPEVHRVQDYSFLLFTFLWRRRQDLMLLQDEIRAQSARRSLVFRLSEWLRRSDIPRLK